MTARLWTLALLAVICLAPDAGIAGAEPVSDRVHRFVDNVVYAPFTRLATEIIFSWPFWLTLTVTLGLEKLFPAEPSQKTFSVSLRQDVVWFLYEPFLNAVVVGTYVAMLVKLHGRYFSSLTFTGLDDTPAWIRLVVGLLVADLCLWSQHYLNHKVPLFWRLHAVHHSQRQLNFFTDFRYHVLEYLVRHTFLAIPLLFLRIELPTIVAVVIVRDWYSRLYHGNIRTNLGPLRYVLVTPQSHRIHHSIEPRHQDKNFGAIFSVWDRLFGQQYDGHDEYPKTGISDRGFPNEETTSPIRLLVWPIVQMRYALRRPS